MSAFGLFRLVFQRLFRVRKRRIDLPKAAVHRKVRRNAGSADGTEKEVQVWFDRRAHLPIVLASGLLDTALEVP
jgi:hypothetical protein